MAQECPRCGLFSPEQATRCDSGYDFVTMTVEASYLMTHALGKHGGEAKIIEESSRTNIRTGVLALAVAGVLFVVSALTEGNAYFWGGAVISGVLLLIRGLRQRQNSLDTETRNDLLRRS